jgi:hypothetical protein
MNEEIKSQKRQFKQIFRKEESRPSKVLLNYKTERHRTIGRPVIRQECEKSFSLTKVKVELFLGLNPCRSKY